MRTEVTWLHLAEVADPAGSTAAASWKPPATSSQGSAFTIPVLLEGGRRGLCPAMRHQACWEQGDRTASCSKIGGPGAFWEHTETSQTTPDAPQGSHCACFGT